MVAVSLALLFTGLRFEVEQASRGLSDIAELLVQIYISFSFGSEKYNVLDEHIFSVTDMISIHGTFSLQNHLHSSTETPNEKLS